MSPRSRRTPVAEAGDEQVKQRTRFLSEIEPFNGLSKLELERVARSVVERLAPAGESVLVESGVPGTELYVVYDGTLELVHKEAVIAVITRGEVFGHTTLLTGLPPEFTTRARVDAILYCIPRDVAFDLLRHPEGLMWLAGNQRERLIQAARTMRSLPDVRNRPVTSVVRSSPLICDPDTPIREAARIFGDRVGFSNNQYEILKGADALAIITEWSEYRNPDFEKIKTLLRHPLLFDGRNLYEPHRMSLAGFEYFPIGRNGN